MSYWYNWFSWWWAHGRSKQVQNWNKHTRKWTVHQVGYLRELYRDMSRYVGDRLLCRFGWNFMQFHPNLHNRRSPTKSDIYQMSYWYNWLSWWWAHGCSKHVENLTKHIRKKLCIKLVIYKDYTDMHGQQNIKLILLHSILRQYFF